METVKKCVKCSAVKSDGTPCQRVASCRKGCKYYCWQHAEKNTKTKCVDGQGKQSSTTKRPRSASPKRKTTKKTSEVKPPPKKATPSKKKRATTPSKKKTTSTVQPPPKRAPSVSEAPKKNVTAPAVKFSSVVSNQGSDFMRSNVPLRAPKPVQPPVKFSSVVSNEGPDFMRSNAPLFTPKPVQPRQSEDDFLRNVNKWVEEYIKKYEAIDPEEKFTRFEQTAAGHLVGSSFRSEEHDMDDLDPSDFDDEYEYDNEIEEREESFVKFLHSLEKDLNKMIKERGGKQADDYLYFLQPQEKGSFEFRIKRK